MLEPISIWLVTAMLVMILSDGISLFHYLLGSVITAAAFGVYG